MACDVLAQELGLSPSAARLRVAVADMAHCSRFVMDTLLKQPSVQDCKTSLVLDRCRSTTALPV
jgi:Lrp/AsnC family leucine-responsive transcriptional regulator